ncbi:MAG: extracellular solute-binding protein [Actinobacteria bacterium]|nr:extracellular solute-binding protein [Actinomycetota bacterium]
MKRVLLLVMVSTIILSFILAGAISGCKQGTTATTKAETTVSETETTAAAETTAAETTATKPEDISGEISYWSWLPRPETQWPEVIAAFNAKYPNIKIDFNRRKWADHVTALKTAMLGGQGPDVFALQSGDAFQAYLEFIEPLAPYAEKAWGPNWYENYNDIAINWMKEIDKDFRWIPVTVGGMFVCAYDADLFAQVGAKPPETLDELKEALKKFKENPIKGVDPYFGVSWPMGINNFFYKAAEEIKPGMVYKAGNEGSISWTDPVFVEAAEYIKRLADEKIVQPGASSMAWYPDLTYDNFITSKPSRYPIIMGGTYVMGELLTKSKEVNKVTDKTFGVIPMFNLTGSGDPTLLFGVNQAFAINKDCKNKEAAWKWIEWNMTEGQAIWQNQMENLAALKNTPINIEDRVGNEAERESIQNVIDWLNKTKFSPTARRTLNYPELEKAIIDNLTLYVSGTLTVENALKKNR